MTIFSVIISNTIYILFPLCLYLIYIVYARNSDIKEKNYFLDLALITSIYMLLRFGGSFKTLYPALLYTIPLLICYIKNKVKLATIISIVLIIFNYINLHFDIYVLVVEYLLYYLVYYFNTKNTNRISKITYFFIVIRTLVTTMETSFYILPNASYINILYHIFISTMIYSVIAYITIFMFNKAENTVDYNSTLNELNREKEIRQSLFKITHEVKNPLAVCKGYLDILECQDKKDYKKYIPIITSEINRTLSLMDDFLDYTKIKVNLEDTDIYMLLEEIRDEIKPLLKRNNIKFQFNIPEDELYLDIDYNRIKQVLVNLYKNSMEAKNGNMTITLNTEIISDKLKIRVSDNGCGMSLETLNKVGESFYTTKKNGTGLGVSLSKEIMRLHDGSLEYESEENIGTTAILTFPLKKEA